MIVKKYNIFLGNTTAFVSAFVSGTTISSTVREISSYIEDLTNDYTKQSENLLSSVNNEKPSVQIPADINYGNINALVGDADSKFQTGNTQSIIDELTHKKDELTQKYEAAKPNNVKTIVYELNSVLTGLISQDELKTGVDINYTINETNNRLHIPTQFISGYTITLSARIF